MLGPLDPVGLLPDFEVCSSGHSEMAEQQLVALRKWMSIHILPQEDHKGIDTHGSRIKIWPRTARGHRKYSFSGKGSDSMHQETQQSSHMHTFQDVDF